MIVIKLGGSLAKSGQLLACLDTVEREYQGRAVVLVPGGGDFADQVRAAQQVWRYSDRIAHEMALLAMQQMALVFHGLKANWVIAHSVAEMQSKSADQVVIWSPNVVELDQTGVPASWDVTSDSLAAWLANTLSATELILVKSVPINPELGLAGLAAQGIIDRAFGDFVAASAFRLRIINACDWNARN